MKIKIKGKNSIGDAYSSYHGKVHNVRLSSNTNIFPARYTPMNSASAGHPVVGKKIKHSDTE